MQFNDSILFFICSLGVFNGILVSLYFLLFNKQKRAQNFLFGLTTLFLTIRIAKSVYVIFTEREDRNILFIQIGLSACFMIGVSLYHYVRAVLEHKKRVPNSWRIHMIVLLLFVITVGIIRPYEIYPDFWNTFFVWLIYAVWGSYLLVTGYILRNQLSKLLSPKSSLKALEQWLLAVWSANILIFTAYLIGYFYLYYVGTITFSVVFYGLLIFFLFKKNRDVIFKETQEKYADKRIDDDEAKHLLSQLTKLMQEKHLYKDTDVKLQKVASQMHISGHKLSQLLNDNLGKNFNTFVNDFRVEEAKKLLIGNQKLTLEAIGYESGFSSKSNFYNTFKKSVGMTPSEYQKTRS